MVPWDRRPRNPGEVAAIAGGRHRLWTLQSKAQGFADVTAASSTAANKDQSKDTGNANGGSLQRSEKRR